MAWFRLQDGILDDSKIQNLPADVFKDWINILCLAKRHDGFIPAIKDVSFAFRVSESSAAEKLEELKKHGLFEDTKKGIMPHNWLKYQYKSDISKKRVKRFRKRRETVSRNAPEQNRTETDIGKKESPQEGAKERTPAKPAPPPKEAADGKPKQKPTRGTRMAEGWQPDPKDTAFAIKRGYTVLQIESLADGLRAYSADKGTASKDWNARWRTWVLHDLDFHGPPGTRQSKHGGADEGVGGFAAAAISVAAGMEGRGNGVGNSGEVHGGSATRAKSGSAEPDIEHHDSPAAEGNCQGTDDAERPDQAPKG